MKRNRAATYSTAQHGTGSRAVERGPVVGWPALPASLWYDGDLGMGEALAYSLPPTGSFPCLMCVLVPPQYAPLARLCPRHRPRSRTVALHRAKNKTCTRAANPFLGD